MAELLRSAARAVYDDRPADAVALDSLADAFGECRRGKAFREATCGAYHFRPTSCHVRLCPDCERARATRLVERFEECADTMESPKLWTLTVPNVPAGELAGGLRVLLDSLAHLRRRAIFAGGPCQGAHRPEAYEDPATGATFPSTGDSEPCSHPPHRKELAAVGSCRCARCLEVVVRSDGYRVTSTGCPRCCHQPVRGGIYSLEITWSEARGDWHPHAHLLVDAPWIAWSEVRDAWRAVTCDAIRRHELKATGKGGRIGKCPHLADSKGLAAYGCHGASVVWVSAVGQPGQERRAAVRETLKYLSKGLLGKDGHLLPGATELDLAELLLAVRRRRLVAGWGTFRNVHDDDEEGLDPAEYIVSGPEVIPEMVGLPRKCPTCHAEALWEFPVNVWRTSCRRSSAGNLVWRPPERFRQ